MNIFEKLLKREREMHQGNNYHNRYIIERNNESMCSNTIQLIAHGTRRHTQHRASTHEIERN